MLEKLMNTNLGMQARKQAFKGQLTFNLTIDTNLILLLPNLSIQKCTAQKVIVFV